MQKSRRQPQLSLTVRRFRKRKRCCLVIAIPQAGIAAPTLTVMQGFPAKKRLLHASPFPFHGIPSIFRILPFHTFGARARIEPGYDGWKASVLTTTLRQSQQCSVKMPHLNQVYEKKAIEGYA